MSCSVSLRRKKRGYLMTLMDRHTSCILAWLVDWEQSEALLQAMVDDVPQAKFYFSDLFATYRKQVYSPGRYTPMPDKSETYRVEDDNAEFRHYLARLARRSRCFSRCIHALRRAGHEWSLKNNQRHQIDAVFSCRRT
ncbi:MAG: hypothetical protein GC204_05015 [Chloroflexi bacterium]|nr:hypothetical protein [Chloroflexota bacterium]